MTRTLKLRALALALSTVTASSAFAVEGNVPQGIPSLDHVFVLMMENHSAEQLLNNPDAPFINSYVKSPSVSSTTNFFAVGHPSLTNYLETVGGSNFGVRSDNAPDFHNATCSPNLGTGIANTDGTPPADSGISVEHGNVCPIAGVGVDAETPAIDSWNEIAAPYAFLADVDGTRAIPAKHGIEGKTIADQLAAVRGTWKTYQESLPFAGPDLVTYSNGTVTDLTINQLPNLASLPASPGSYVKAYAAKHNPFVYFKSVQEGSAPGLSYANVRAFDGAGGLYADLATGNVANYTFIAPNQCNDMHGRGNGDSFCGFDPQSTGTQVGLNPGLIAQGDATVQRIVSAIKASPAWHDGHSAIVVMWDENDYSGTAALNADGSYPATAPVNDVLVTVETNYRKSPAVVSKRYYNHFSLLKTIEAGLGLPCLNHACDEGVKVMSDLFAR